MICMKFCQFALWASIWFDCLKWLIHWKNTCVLHDAYCCHFVHHQSWHFNNLNVRLGMVFNILFSRNFIWPYSDRRSIKCNQNRTYNNKWHPNMWYLLWGLITPSRQKHHTIKQCNCLSSNSSVSQCVLNNIFRKMHE